MLWIYWIVWVTGKKLFKENTDPSSLFSKTAGTISCWNYVPENTEREEAKFERGEHHE